jgi:integrase
MPKSRPPGASTVLIKKTSLLKRKGARAKTINFEIDTLRTIFNLAIKWEYLKENPTQKITRLKVSDSKAPRFLTKEECRRFLDHCPDNLRPIYLTFLNTGMRKAELENLEWADIDFDRRHIKIRRKPFWKPKSGEREIPINQQLFDLLTRLKKANDRGVKSNFVFPHTDGSKLKTKLRRMLIRVAEEAGIENLTTLHALRHTFASQLIMKGVDLPTIQKLLGHSDIQTTMIYSHLAPDHLADAVEELSLSD